MNEELKIIIKAFTDDAQKKIQGVQKDLNGLKDKGSGAFASIGKFAKGAATVVAGVATAIAGVITALTAASKTTEDYRKSMAQLTTAFQANGSSAAQAKKTYGELFRFMGETDTAVEASNLLSQLTTDEKELAQWTKTLQGVYATFPDSLPIESLVEASNETAKVGKVTGTLADALNWAGVSEDAFNAQLATTNSLAERETLIRQTLSGLYNDAAELYEKNAANILAQNEAQNRLNETLAKIGETTTPLVTALTNLSSALLNMLAPAINAITPFLVSFINILSKAVGWVTNLISALTGSNKAAKATQQIANSGKAISNGFKAATGGTGALTNGINKATAAAEELKRTTQGFDELNIVSSGTTSAAGSGAGAGGTSGGAGAGAGFATGLGAGAIGDLGLDDAFDKTSASAEKFAAKIKGIFEKIKQAAKDWANLFTPSIEAWKTAFGNLAMPISNAFGTIKTSFNGFVEETLAPFGSYLFEDFIPTITNAFSENFAPIFSDIAGFAIEQFALDFQWGMEQTSLAVNDILMPALELVKTVTTDVLNAVGEEWQNSGANLLELFGGVRDSIKGIWENLYNNILKPIWDIIINELDSIWKEHIEPLWKQLLSFFSKLGECVMTIWNNFLAPIVNWIITVLSPIIVNAVKSIMSVVNTVVGIVSGVVKGVLKALGGLLDFITGVFSGNWGKAWQGIKDFFGGIWDGIWAVVKGIVNLIIDGINNLWTGIYSVVKGIVDGIGGIAGAIGDIFGQDWHFKMPANPPRIPKLANGGIVNSATIAMIGERGKEAVLPLENNTEWIDMLANRIAEKQNTPSKIVLMLDGKELGYAAINSINNITKQTGALQLALA